MPPVIRQVLLETWLAKSSNTGSPSDSSGSNMVRNFTVFRHADFVSASGRLQNLSCATGSPSFEMSRSLRYQSLPTELLFPATNVNDYGMASTVACTRGCGQGLRLRGSGAQSVTRQLVHSVTKQMLHPRCERVTRRATTQRPFFDKRG